MKTGLFLALLGILLFVPAGCGGGNKDEGRATLRGVVVDGNPYSNTQDIVGTCLSTNTACSYKDPLPSPIADADVRIYRSEGGLVGSIEQVANIKTDSAGRFAVTLPPGLYEVNTRSLSKEKIDAGYCASGGLLTLSKHQDRYIVIGNDLCANFAFVVE